MDLNIDPNPIVLVRQKNPNIHRIPTTTTTFIANAAANTTHPPPTPLARTRMTLRSNPNVRNLPKTRANGTTNDARLNLPPLFLPLVLRHRQIGTDGGGGDGRDTTMVAT
jgi:hypothetical protein